MPMLTESESVTEEVWKVRFSQGRGLTGVLQFRRESIARYYASCLRDSGASVKMTHGPAIPGKWIQGPAEQPGGK